MRYEPGRTKKCIPIGEVCDRTSLGKSCIYSMIKRGKFPKPRQLTRGRVGWDLASVDQWIESRPVAGEEIAA
jgi:prophage regulatory protein